MGAGQGRFPDPSNRLSGTALLLRDASDASLSTACSLDLSISAAASSVGLPELSEPIGGELDEETNHQLHNERLRSRSPPPHHLPPPPPPPPTLSGRNHELRLFSGSNFSPLHAQLHGQTSLHNRSSSPAHDLGYHTLVARSPAAPWSSPADLTDLTLTPSPRAEYCRKTSYTSSNSSSQQRDPFTQIQSNNSCLRPQLPPTPTSPSISVDTGSTEALLAACKGKRWVTPSLSQQLGGSFKFSYFDQLTDDVLLRVFSFLSSSHLALCSRVCRRWHVLAWEPQLWSSIYLSGDNLHTDRALKSITRVVGRASPPFCPAVERVVINSCSRLTDRGLQTLSRRCPELRHVELRGCVQLTDVGVLELVSKCVHLTHLDVSGCSQITCIDAGPLRANGNNGDRYKSDLCSNSRPQLYLQLQYIDLTDCVSLEDSGIQMIVRSCAQLTCIYLRRCVHITDLGVKYLASYCTGLRELSISDCVQVTDFGMYELARLGPNLRYLSVAKCDQISDAGIKQIGRHCYKLRYLNLRGCEAVSDDSLVVLARTCSRLRALDLGKCDITDRGLRLLAEHCPNLKKLSVKSCELVTDEGVRSIAYYCRGLRQLNIQDCLITVEGYRAVKKFCRKCIIEHTNPGFF
ncbi:LOW QUALITY PROTEIN: F-box/LRR-repeat protein 7 [Daphnia magna]|uniref:LOW QUALITY PROTEIN: F-box/LRR-repeat protein 7 n=1 Tax=Daphnia magna TaxID=35525 RepID=UPI001E1BCB82|nr:LOW QUALITY PROTEIN: F-box/LRR-repeat protein 7 [Daphnia magna]